MPYQGAAGARGLEDAYPELKPFRHADRAQEFVPTSMPKVVRRVSTSSRGTDNPTGVTGRFTDTREGRQAADSWAKTFYGIRTRIDAWVVTSSFATRKGANAGPLSGRWRRRPSNRTASCFGLRRPMFLNRQLGHHARSRPPLAGQGVEDSGAMSAAKS
jgi:hypothetical protein